VLLLSTGTTDKSTTCFIYALWLCLRLKFQAYARKPPTNFEIFPFGTSNFEAPHWLHNFCVSWQGNSFTNCWNIFVFARQWDLLAVSCRWFEVICGQQYGGQVPNTFFQTQPVIKYTKGVSINKTSQQDIL